MTESREGSGRDEYCETEGDVNHLYLLQIPEDMQAWICDGSGSEAEMGQIRQLSNVLHSIVRNSFSLSKKQKERKKKKKKNKKRKQVKRGKLDTFAPPKI